MTIIRKFVIPEVGDHWTTTCENLLT